VKVAFLKNTCTIKKLAQFIALLITVLAVAVACGPGAPPSGGGTALSVSSTAFKDGGTIPAKYAYDTGDVSPPLTWTAGPAGTQSYVVIMEDIDWEKETKRPPDPRLWILFNIPANVLSLPEGLPKQEKLDNGALHGKNCYAEDYYAGPRPSLGITHRYKFTVYALDKLLDLPAGSSADQVLAAMQGHIIAQGELIGKYQI